MKNIIQQHVITSIVFFLMLSLGSFAQTKLPRVTFSIKDNTTGFAIPNCKIQVITPTGSVIDYKVEKNNPLVFVSKTLKGRYNFIISAKGYRALETYFVLQENDVINAEINLDPIIKENDRDKLLKSIDHIKTSNLVVLTGHVSDEISGDPLSNVKVKAGNYETFTNGKGVFKLTIPAAAIIQDKVPEHISIQFSKSGYISYTRDKFYLIPDHYSLKISLASFKNKTPKIKGIVDIDGHGMFDRTKSDEDQSYIEFLKYISSDEYSKSDTSVPGKISVPSSIRVGINCSCNSCSSVRVMSLESYVQSGLNDEWIASWRSNSLKAGAVGYRSYGAYYVLHPVSSRYDISNTTCRQVWDSDVATSAKNAAIATAGEVLLKGGNIFRSEYSAENNNAGCGDGYSGTGSSWPCISDPRDKGRAKFGHGRGMCQWGSQRWSSDKDYLWILNHYYVPGGVSVSTGNCPSDLNLTGTINSGTYKSSNTITASGTVNSGRNVVFESNEIVLNPNFTVNTNATFEARSGNGCNRSRNNTSLEVAAETAELSGGPVPFGITKLYPNPASKRVTIQYHTPGLHPVAIHITNMLGKVISKRFVSNPTKTHGYREVSLDISDLTSGMYFIKFSSGAHTDTQSLIVNHQ